MENLKPLVSVVLPVFNGEKFVGNAIRSIQQQTFEDWELVILDDCSTDNSFDVCSTFAAKDGRIRLSRNTENKGLAKAMNALVSLARGEYIAVQEQDDISVSERLLLETEILQNKPEIGCVSGIAAWLNDNGEVFNYFPELLVNGKQYPQNQQDMVQYLYTEQCKVVNAACMYRRSSTLHMNGPYDPDARMSIDWQFFMHLAHKYLFFGIPKVLLRMHRGSSHPSLTKRRNLQFSEANRCISLMYEKYKDVQNSPINYWQYRKAKSAELVIEGRICAGFRGLLKFIASIFYNPANKRSYKSIGQLLLRGMKKLNVQGET